GRAEAVRLRVRRVQDDRTVEETQRLGGADIRALAVEEECAEEGLPRVQAFRLLPLRALVLGGVDLRLDTADHALGDLILDCEDVLASTVVALCPDVFPGLS